MACLDEEQFSIPKNFPANVIPYVQKHFELINTNHCTPEHLRCFKLFIKEPEMTDFWRAVSAMPETLPDPCPRPAPFTIESVFSSFLIGFLNWENKPEISKGEHEKAFQKIEVALKKIKAECSKDQRIKAQMDQSLSRIISQILDHKNQKIENSLNFNDLEYPEFLTLINSLIKTIDNRRKLGLENTHYNFFPKRAVKKDVMSANQPSAWNSKNQ